MDATQNMSPLNQTNHLLNFHFLRFDDPQVLAKVRGDGLCLVTPSDGCGEACGSATTEAQTNR